MKQLEIEIIKKGFTYLQVAKSEHAYIYAQYSDQKLIAYEVFQHKEYQEAERFGKIMPAGVSFPGDESFGLWAWTFKKLESATAKFTELTQDGVRKKLEKLAA